MKTSSPFSSVERCGVMRVRVVSLIFRHCIPHKTLDPPPFSAPLLPPMNPEDSNFFNYSFLFEKRLRCSKLLPLVLCATLQTPPRGTDPWRAVRGRAGPRAKRPAPENAPSPGRWWPDAVHKTRFKPALLLLMLHSSFFHLFRRRLTTPQGGPLLTPRPPTTPGGPIECPHVP